MYTHIKQYLLLVNWQILRLRTILPLFVAIQIMTGIGFTIGLGFMFPDIDSATALFFVTGGPTLILIMVGMVLLPQMIAEDKSSGSLTYIWALPISRITYLLADLTVWFVCILPGIALALAIGSWYYRFSLVISWMFFPATFFVGMTASCIGYGIAHFVSKPQAISLITNLLLFVVFLFSPIHYPLAHLPIWLQRLHILLPFSYMSDLMRSSLTEYEIDSPGKAFSIMSIWLLISFVSVAVVLQKRK